MSTLNHATREEFLATVQAFLEGRKCYEYTDTLKDRNLSYYARSRGETLRKGHFLYERVSTGGVSGGSCWNEGNEDNHSHYSSDETLQGLRGIDIVLKVMTPQITLLQYRKLTEKLIQHGYYTEYEYYGNSTDYQFQYCELGELYDRIQACIAG